MSKRSGKRKITVGFVVQTFDNNNKCTEQEFHAGDQVDYEDDAGEPIDSWDEYQPFQMVQPQAMTVALVGNLSDGYQAVGPFVDFEEAARWAEGQESWILTMQSPYEESDSAHGVTPGQIQFLVQTLENPHRSLQIRVDSVARQIEAFKQARQPEKIERRIE